eukprot:1154818-Amphidinium_carterae.1
MQFKVGHLLWRQPIGNILVIGSHAWGRSYDTSSLILTPCCCWWPLVSSRRGWSHLPYFAVIAYIETALWSPAPCLVEAQCAVQHH